MNKDKIIKFFETEVELYDDPKAQHIGLIVDCETTGLNYKTDNMFEIAIIPFKFNDDYKVCAIGKPYIGYEEHKLSEFTKRLCMVPDDSVLIGKAFDDGKIMELFNKADVVIAHNSSFDRKFFEKRFPYLKDQVWACSMKQIDWRNIEIGSASLDYIAFRYGFWFEKHRAVNDTFATLNILSMDYREGVTNLKVMLHEAFKPDVEFHVHNYPFDQKDDLKYRGYRWSAKNKTWYKNVQEPDFDTEREWLYKTGDSRTQVEEVFIDAKSRFK